MQSSSGAQHDQENGGDIFVVDPAAAAQMILFGLPCCPLYYLVLFTTTTPPRATLRALRYHTPTLLASSPAPALTFSPRPPSPMLALTLMHWS